MLDSAVSTKAFENRRPTLPSSASLTVMRHWAVAASLLSGSRCSVRTTRSRTNAKSLGRRGTGCPEGSRDGSRLGVDVESGQCDGDVVAVPADRVGRNLQRRRRRLAHHARDGDPVAGQLLEPDRVEASGHVGSEVARAADLVQQLRGDRPDRDLATGGVVLADHRRTVGGHVGPREADVFDAGHLGEERVVAARGLTRALDHVTGDHRPRRARSSRRVASRGATPPGHTSGRRR